MLKDADHSYFAGVYIVCGYTDLRFGIDSLAAIIERRFHMHLFVEFFAAGDVLVLGVVEDQVLYAELLCQFAGVFG